MDQTSTATLLPSLAAERRKFTIDQYLRMADAGILTDEDRVELIEGDVLEMPPIYSPHAGTVNRLVLLLAPALATRAILAVQNPLDLPDKTQVLPDLAVLRPRADSYKRANPRPDDVLLVVEVADTSLARDRDVKRPLYARHGIPEMWIVDIGANAVEVCREPTSGGYTSVAVARHGDVLAVQSLPGLTLATADVLD